MFFYQRKLLKVTALLFRLFILLPGYVIKRVHGHKATFVENDVLETGRQTQIRISAAVFRPFLACIT